jgi:hypothetical protein
VQNDVREIRNILWLVLFSGDSNQGKKKTIFFFLHSGNQDVATSLETD